MVYFYVFFIVLIFFVNGFLVALEDMGGKGNFNFDILTIKKITSGEKTDFLWGGGQGVNLAVSNVDINFFAVCLKKFHRDTEVVDAILNRTTEFIRKISAVCTVKIFTKS